MAICSSLSAQVGIRTEDPRGMLHVDARGDTYINGVDTLDDVVVTPEGRIGVGTLNPQARLHIVGPKGKAIRIADTSEGGGKILTSFDNTGRAHWTALVGSWYAALKGGQSLGEVTGSGTTGWPDFTYASFEESLPGCVNLAEGSITIPYTASYRITITGKGHTNRNTTVFMVYLHVNADGGYVFRPHQHSFKSFSPLNFGFMAHLSLNANQVVALVPVRGGDQNANRYTDVLLHIELIQ